MTPDMLAQVTMLVIALAMGLLGATFRIFIQYRRDGELPQNGFDLYVEGFLGMGGGFLSWMFTPSEDWRVVAMLALIAGYAGAYAIERWLAPKD